MLASNSILINSTTRRISCVRLQSARLLQPAQSWKVIAGGNIRPHSATASRYHHRRFGRTQQLHQRRQGFSTAIKQQTASQSSSGGTGRSFFQFSRVRVLAKVVRYVRIPALILSVYGLGYQQGIIDYSRDPDKKQDELLTTILAGVGCHSRDDVRTSTEGSWSNKNKATAVAASAAASVMKGRGTAADDGEVQPTSTSIYERERQFRRVGTVAERMTGVARKFVDEELQKIMSARMEELPKSIVDDDDKLYRTLLRDDEFRLWAHAKQRMEGKWRYHLITSDIPNAFVSELLPQRIFVTTSMLEKFVHTDDEMALILGHELSHLILGHVSDSNTLATFLRTVEVLLLSIDPTEGVLSLGFMTLLAGSRAALTAANSRDNEAEADALGIKLSAMGCYDTRAAAEVFDRMHKHDTESGEAKAEEAMSSGGSLLSFLDTHPPTEERYDYLIRASEEENAERYSTAKGGCGGLRGIFREMLEVNKGSEKEASNA